MHKADHRSVGDPNREKRLKIGGQKPKKSDSRSSFLFFWALLGASFHVFGCIKGGPNGQKNPPRGIFFSKPPRGGLI